MRRWIGAAVIVLALVGSYAVRDNLVEARHEATVFKGRCFYIRQADAEVGTAEWARLVEAYDEAGCAWDRTYDERWTKPLALLVLVGGIAAGLVILVPTFRRRET